MGHSFPMNGGWAGGWWSLNQPLTWLIGLGLLAILVLFIWRSARVEPTTPKVRTPMVNVFADSKQSIVIAELPGVEQDEILVNIEEGYLVSVETTGARKYATTVPLSDTVDASSMQKTFSNGLLELRLQKA